MHRSQTLLHKVKNKNKTKNKTKKNNNVVDVIGMCTINQSITISWQLNLNININPTLTPKY